MFCDSRFHLAIRYPLLVTKALSNCFLWLCLGTRRPWFGKRVYLLRFNQTTIFDLTKVHLLPKPNHRQDSGSETWSLLSKSCALHVRHQPQPPPYDSCTKHKCSAPSIRKNIVSLITITRLCCNMLS